MNRKGIVGISHGSGISDEDLEYYRAWLNAISHLAKCSVGAAVSHSPGENSDIIDDLRFSRAAFIDECSKVDGLITDMEEMIVSLEGRCGRATRRTARGAIRALLRTEGRTMAKSEIVARAKEFGTVAQSDTIRGAITEMVRSGELERPSRGQYQLRRLR